MGRDYNFQNVPSRDAEFGALVRRAFVPRPGRRLVEVDFKGVEVSVAACYNRDPALIAYCKDPTKDMHRDMAMQLYFLDEKQVTKQARYGAKNGFVFPEFYGSYFKQCAPPLWETAGKVTLPCGTPLREHLAARGIKELGPCDKKDDRPPAAGTFEKHVRDVERDFWDNRFRAYAQWKKDWYAAYLKDGRFRGLTGFVEQGWAGKKAPIMSRNDVVNHPIQGSAFHCLLWTLIRVQRTIRRAKKETLLVGQIHDSALADVPDRETQWYCTAVDRVVTDELPARWDWIIVPLRVEVEATPLAEDGGSWFDKTPWARDAAGVWGPET